MERVSHFSDVQMMGILVGFGFGGTCGALAALKRKIPLGSPESMGTIINGAVIGTLVGCWVPLAIVAVTMCRR